MVFIHLTTITEGNCILKWELLPGYRCQVSWFWKLWNTFFYASRNTLRALTRLFPSSAFPFLAAHSFRRNWYYFWYYFCVSSFYCLPALEYEPIIEAVKRTSLPPKTTEVLRFCSFPSGCSYIASSANKTNCNEINNFLQNFDRFVTCHFPSVRDNGNV